MTGKIHWGQKVRVAFRQEAWSDVSVYEVPFSGVGDANRMAAALTCGKHDKRPKPYIGSCGSVNVIEVDDVRKVVKVEISYPIGD